MPNVSNIQYNGTTYGIEGVTDATLTISGRAADAAAVGAALARGSMLTEEAKQALLACFAQVAWIGDDGQDYYDTLEAALYPPTNLVSISAVYTQSGTVYDTDSLDSLRSGLVVAATYSDSSTSVVTTYTLSGTLAEGTSTITVAYGGKTTTFNVTVTHQIVGWYYTFNDTILSQGTHDFGFSGVQNYATGVNGKSYFHEVGTEGDSSTDPLGLYALQSADSPTWGSNDFTISGWQKCVEPKRGHLFNAANYLGTSALAWTAVSVSIVNSNWSVLHQTITKKYCGIRLGMYAYESKPTNLCVTITNSNNTNGCIFMITPPQSFDTTQWHHYALTRSGNTLYYFVDGTLIFTASLPSGAGLYSSNYITVGNFMSENTNNTPAPYPYSAYFDDLYVNVGTAKWTSDFDPSEIVY